VARAAEILRARGGSVTVLPTTGPATAGEIARDAISGGADLIVVAGGDGTINEAAAGLVHTGVPMGILPAGTANVLATEMRLGRNWDAAVRQLAASQPRRIAVGTATLGAASRHFLLMAGIGLDAQVVARVDNALKARTGKFAYWVAGWSLVGSPLREFRARVDGVEKVCSFALACRVRNYGGDLEIARGVTLFDDDFEVVLFEGSSGLPYVKYFAGVALNRLRGMRGVTILRARSLELEGEGVYVQVDGELLGSLPARIELAPDALTLLVPPGYTPQQ
jgi:diacylglycerol kinase (ATP)